jgi:hypothetical protein
VAGKAASRQRGNKAIRRFIRDSGNRKTAMLGRNSNPAQRDEVITFAKLCFAPVDKGGYGGFALDPA